MFFAGTFIVHVCYQIQNLSPTISKTFKSGLFLEVPDTASQFRETAQTFVD